MRSFIPIVTILVAIIAAGAGILLLNHNESNNDSGSDTEGGNGPEVQETGDYLVVFFSRAGEQYDVGTVEKGNTAIVADMIAEHIGADVFEIVPEDGHYPMTYSELTEVARAEKDADARPAYKGTAPDLGDYDRIFIGSPVWWGDWPMIMYTFFERNDLSGKDVTIFSTHAGSGLSTFHENLARVCPGCDITDGISVRGSDAQRSPDTVRAKVIEWLDEVIPSEPEGPVFDLDKGMVRLNSGYDMPILGIGTFALSTKQAENSVYWALRDGFRLIDTARIYGNETGVGKGIQRAIDEGIVTRGEIFVTTKLWTSDYDNGESAIQGSLDRLGLDYIDLMILHHSQPSNDVTAYKSMEKAVSEGKIRSIGLSNYYDTEDFDRMVKSATIMPALLQNETHPYHQSGEMKDHIAKYGTVMESWFPLGGRGNTQTLFNDPTISSIADSHGKSSAQTIIRWHLQAGNICIPGSSNESHIAENFDVWDFSLSDEEMARMTALERDERLADY